jgi:steroid delta-isomerase-like uncharacterized protein
MSSLEHAQRWCEALGSDVEALADLYKDQWFTSESSMVDDNMVDTVTDRDGLREAYGPLSSGENGTYTFTATEWCGGRSDQGLIHWNVTIEGARTFRGIPVPEGQTLEAVGSTFQKFDADGKISFESTYWEDNRIFVQLGIPILRPHYYKEDFDMEAFLASIA